MRFAFSTSPQLCTFDELAAVWRAADAVELWESGWTFDHFEPILVGDRTGPCLEGWVTLTALLAATERLRGGVLVTGMVYRHAAVLANMAATLDHTSHGRLELGLGAAWNTDECDAYGIVLGSLTERFDRFAEGLEVIEKLLTQPRSSFEGRYYTLRDAYCEPKAVQRPHPPIVIGGSGERRTLPLVARYAQHWNYPGTAEDPIAELHRLRGLLERYCAEIGRDPSEISVSTMLFAGRLPLPDVLERARQYRDAGIDLGIVSLPKPLQPADVHRLADAFGAL
jgi:F420-dependent oxidoreductase-like protein